MWGVLEDRVRRLTVVLSDDGNGDFSSGKRFMPQIFILKQLWEKAQHKICSVCRLYGLEKDRTAKIKRSQSE